MVEDDHRHHEDYLAAYLLDALTPDEVREFRAHLDGCARCQSDERWLRTAVEMLPSSVEQFEAPRDLRNRLMARVNIESANDRAPAREAPSRHRWWSLALRPAAALAVLAIAAAGVGGYLIGNDNGGGAKTTTVQAKATPEQPDAQANIVRTGERAELNVQRLPALRRGRIYETWLQRGTNKPERSTLFVVDKNGMGSAAVTGDLDGVTTVLVSEEPEGGSDQPTSKPVLIANL
jgi:anti-sigma factor RsiW